MMASVRGLPLWGWLHKWIGLLLRAPALISLIDRSIHLWAWPRRRIGWFSTCLWLHRWTGLITLPFFLVLCLTGSVLIFHDELDALLGDAPPTAAAAGPDAPLARIVEAGVASQPGLRPLLVSLPDDAPDRAYVRLARPGVATLENSKLALIGRSTAASLVFTPPDKSFTGFLLDLHANWLLRKPGQIFGGAVALLVFTCLITGVVIHAPFVRQLLFGMVRFGRGPRIVQLDLHNLLGLVTLGWATLVTASGIMLAADAILLPIWQNTELRQMMDKNAAPVVQPVSIDAAVSAARLALPENNFRFAFFPGTEYSGPRHYAVAMYRHHRYDAQLFDFVAVDAGSGEVTAIRSLPLYLKVVLFSVPLHFGNYGGLLLKLFWLASCWGALFITGNGAWLWWRRRRRPARRSRT